MDGGVELNGRVRYVFELGCKGVFKVGMPTCLAMYFRGVGLDGGCGFGGCHG